MKKGSNFLWGSSINRYNIRVIIQFTRERRSQHLKRSFFCKNRPNYFHFNSISIIRPDKWNKLTFSSIEINKLLLSSLEGFSWIKSMFRFPITPRVESGIISIDTNITYSIIRKVISLYCRIKSVALRKIRRVNRF